MINTSASAAPVLDLRLQRFLILRAAHRRQLEVAAEVARLLQTARHSRQILSLVGPTGVGKTNLIESIEKDAETAFVKRGSPVGEKASLRVNAAPPQHDTFRFPGLYRGILDAADDYFNQRARLGRLRTSDELQDAAINVLRHRRPEVLIIDEAQHITYAVRPGRLAQHLDNLKWLADQIPCPILLVGTVELLRFSLLSAQLARRMNQVPFLPYRPVPDDLKAFLGVAQTLLTAMPLTYAFSLAAHRDLFFDGAAGSVGLLKQWFTRVVEDAIAKGRTSATIQDFETHRVPLGQLTLIANEYAQMQEGLGRLNGTQAALREALGYPAPAAPSNDGVTTTPTPVTSLLPGTRTLGRDRVGAAATDDAA